MAQRYAAIEFCLGVGGGRLAGAKKGVALRDEIIQRGIALRADNTVALKDKEPLGRIEPGLVEPGVDKEVRQCGSRADIVLFRDGLEEESLRGNGAPDCWRGEYDVMCGGRAHEAKRPVGRDHGKEVQEKRRKVGDGPVLDEQGDLFAVWSLGGLRDGCIRLACRVLFGVDQRVPGGIEEGRRRERGISRGINSETRCRV